MEATSKVIVKLPYLSVRMEILFFYVYVDSMINVGIY